ncbi:MAG: hypothetical protein SOZ80_00855 [Prevotella sp.]|uniref:hypothetical protein n=1 Tax=Prevotella sp. TaxID=59823 RepID=UPI002A34B48E|nr:hypothetical protein [Prevotella sp.]MDD7318728.1 hypothetical protein [Prevotellaceae bacterium]MDY4019316.1 hypothetical protein [Prevotella sp.]
MKKVLFMAVAAAAISFASCTSNTNKGEANATDSVSTPAVEKVEEDVTKVLQSKLDAKDAAGMQNVLTTINEKIKTLKEEGKLEEAKSLLKQVQDFLANNSDKVNSVIGNNEAINKLVEGVKAIPVDALGAGTEAVENAKGELKDAASSTEKKAEEATEQAKQKVNEKANDAINKAAKGLGL